MDGAGQEEPATAAEPQRRAQTESARPGGVSSAEQDTVERNRQKAGLDPETANRLEQAEVELTPRRELTISLLHNITYHENRESYYGFWDRALNFLVVIIGTAVVATVTHADHPGLVAQAIAVGTTLIGSAQLIFEISKKQFLHEKLCTGFLELLSELTDGNVDETRTKAAKLYGEEPPTYYACDTLAYNAAMRALERPSKYAKRVNLWCRLTRHRFRYADANFRELGDAGFEEGWFRHWLWG